MERIIKATQPGTETTNTYSVRVTETWQVVADYEVRGNTPQEAIANYRQGQGELSSHEVTGCDHERDGTVLVDGVETVA